MNFKKIILSELLWLKSSVQLGVCKSPYYLHQILFFLRKRMCEQDQLPAFADVLYLGEG